MASAIPTSTETPVLDPTFLASFRSGKLTSEQAREFVHRDPLELQFLLLQLSVAVAAGTIPLGPNTPSGSIAPYLKPNANPKKKKGKAGPKPGHDGHYRPIPTRIDKRQTHQLEVCPCCQGALQRTDRKRLRIIEDIPDDLHAQTTEHTIHRDWCPKCKKQVEPVVPDALPGCQLGHRTTVLSAWLHYGLGTTTSQILEVFNGHLQMKLSVGGLTEIWHRLAEVLEPWYEQIHRECLLAGVLHADETGWRTEGVTSWLWCFARDDATYYRIHPKRGHEALKVFFTEAFQGVLVSDFWKVYDIVTQKRQKCWPHLLRDLTAVDEGSESGEDWPEFCKKLWRIYADAVRLEAGIEELQQESYDSRLLRLKTRITDLAVRPWTNRHARRLAKRLFDYGDDLLTFLEIEGVPKSNNKGEREIRPGVMMRKVSFGSYSQQGARTRSILMSIYRTLKLRDPDPLKETESALRTYTLTGKLPALPVKLSSGE
ncbi:IS66 family transposase [Telmatocola sphagniphila]|uniref:IS66 family transposase n=1 Tax=Telmatocola sphagniphila TaxID=1123043 RepID=A0A8E6B3M2_9BACT|nr:IS66 family transposase [Telmatocola sphagniphila]QVL30699.1 IS66 family transposase [Telmatocola sphagniphila]